MATQVCDCNIGLSNTGTPDCEAISKVARMHILVPTFDDTGARNKLDVSVTVTQSVIDALINNADKSKRWYPTPLIDNVEDVRADDLSESLNSGVEIFIQEGSRTMTSIMVKQSPSLNKELQSFMCRSMSAFEIDKDGNLIGTQTNDDLGNLYPIQIQDDTLKPSYIKPTDTTVAKVQLNWTWADVENDGNLKMLASNETVVVFLNESGLIDINVLYSSITTTGFVAKMFADYGTAKTRVTIKGLLIGDFALAETSPTPGAITITSVVENPDGTYTFVMPAATSADVLELTPTKAGYDFARVVDADIVIP